MNIKFSRIMLILSLSVAGCAAYFSIVGLSQLFAGASLSVIIMASILETGKIVTTTALHKYWNDLTKPLKIYLTVSVGVLMIITSAGIYGFLSNAYQSTSNKLNIHDGKVGVLTNKKKLFENKLDENTKIIDSKTKRIDQLSNLRTNQETRLDASTSNRNSKNARIDISNANGEIQVLSKDIEILTNKNSVLTDSIGSYDVKILDLQANNEVAGEIGPLKYISELTGIEMASVVNYLILLLIFVFDPLAVALILMTNKAFDLEANEEKGVETIVEKKIEVIENIIEIETPIEEKPVVEEIKELEDIPVISEEVIVEAPVIEEPIVEEVPVPHKIRLEDIREIKQGRGFSVPIPDSRGSNTIERIGSNKMIMNGENNKFIYKRGT